MALNHPTPILRDMAKAMQDRADNPRVAWDVMAAEGWAKEFRALAKKYAAMPVGLTVAHMNRIRRRAATLGGGMGFYVALDVEKQFAAVMERMRSTASA